MLGFRVGFSSEDFESDFRVRMLSCVFLVFLVTSNPAAT